MGGKNQNGFTIIEVTLFLGVSGLLLIGLLGGVSLAVQRQRYTDSVNSTISFIQKQYNETLNVVNNRNGNEACNQSQVLVSGNPEPIGASDCIVLGKALKFEEDGSLIKTYVVVGENTPDRALEDDDTEWEVIYKYHPKAVKVVGTEDYLIPWDAKTVSINRASVGGERANYVLIVRSPRSGWTMVDNLNVAASDDVNNYVDFSPALLQNNSSAAETKICLQSQDILTAKALITVATDGSQDSVTADFEAASKGLC